MICGQIVVSGTRPGEIFEQAVALEFAPGIAVVINHQGFINLLEQPIARIFIELVSISLPRSALEVADRIVQSANSANDRDRAIFQAVIWFSPQGS